MRRQCMCRQKDRKRSRAGSCNHLPVGRIERDVIGDLALPAVAVREQALLVEQKLLAGLGREFEIRPFDDGVDRTGFLAEAAIDAFDHIDVIARRATRAVTAARPSLDGDGLRRTDRLAELAGDAAFLAVGIATQRVLTAKARRDRSLFKGVVERRFRFEKVAQAEHERRYELLEKDRAGSLIQPHGALLSGKARTLSLSPRPLPQANSRCLRKQ